MAKPAAFTLFSLLLLVALPQAAARADAAHRAPPADAVADPKQGPASSLMPRMTKPMSTGDRLSAVDTVLMSVGLAHSRIEHVEGRLAFLKTELKLTAAQDVPWQAFAGAVRQSARGQNARMAAATRMEPNQSSVVDRLDRLEQRLSAQIDEVRAIRSAFVALHESLTEDQRLMFDRIARLRIMM